MKKKDIPLMTLSQCRGCPAKCCRNLSIWIGAPRTKAEIEDLMWEVRFDTVKIYIRNRRWYLWIKGTCMYLDENNMCKIYETRPDKCREHNPPNCERYGQFWDVMINNPEELQEYLDKRKRAAKRRKKVRERKKQTANRNS
jgi:Fe-S-cluster containining protein